MFYRAHCGDHDWRVALSLPHRSPHPLPNTARRVASRYIKLQRRVASRYIKITLHQAKPRNPAVHPVTLPTAA